MSSFEGNWAPPPPPDGAPHMNHGDLAGFWIRLLAHICDQLSSLIVVVPTGALMTFVALWTGALWGKPTWGTWWVWDARITSMLILLFLYLGVVALYEAYDNKEAAGKACAVLTLVGMVNIPIIYKSVDWWYSLHQPASIKMTGESTIDPSMLYPLLLMIASFYALFTCCLLMNMRAEILEREARTNWVKKLALEYRA